MSGFEYPPIRNATEFVRLVENVLGWVPVHKDAAQEWRTYAMEAGKLKRKIATAPHLYTWDNLVLAVEFLRRKKETPKSPTAVCWAVERALAAAAAPRNNTEIEELLGFALEQEFGNREPGWDDWVGRLTRATGPARMDVYEAWKAART